MANTNVLASTLLLRIILAKDLDWGLKIIGCTSDKDLETCQKQRKCSALHTSNLVDILERQTQRFVRRTLRWIDVVQGIHDGHARVLLFVSLRHFPALEPRHLGTALKHVVAMPARDRHKWNRVRVVANLLDVRRHFLLNLVVARLAAQFARQYKLFH